MEPATIRPRAQWALPIALYVVAVATYVLLGRRHEIPLVFPDELTYGHLARSLADGEGLSWYGQSQSLPMALYVYLLAPSWLLASGESAYEIAKITGAVVVCTVAFPVWVLAARLIPGWRAAIPVVLTLAGTWMLSSAGLLTENLALPLASAALVSAVLALREQGNRWAWSALAFAAAASFARAQMGILFAIMLAALLLDSAFAADRRARLERHRTALIVLGTILAIGAAVVLSGSDSTLGPYVTVSDLRPSLVDVLGAIGEQWIALAVISGVLPLAALLVLAGQPSAWRDRDLGPLLCVAAPAVVLLLLESGYFNAGQPGLDWSIERYVQYAVPLLLVLLIVSLERRRLPAAWLAVATLAIALTLLATPEIRQAVEQRATFATTMMVDGVLGLAPGAALALAALLVGAAGTAIVARRAGARAAVGAGALLLIAFAVQGQWAWRWQLDFTRQIRAQYPKRLTWVDDHAKGPVTRLYVYQNSYLFQRAEVFNSDIKQVLTPAKTGSERPPLGATCPWTIDQRGVLQTAGACGPIRRRIWNDDAYVDMSFHGGRVLARDRFLGQLIAVPPTPRLRSVIRKPCQRATLTLGRNNAPTGIPRNLACPPTMSVFLWVDSPGTLELTFQGGTRSQNVGYRKRTWVIAPRRRVVVRIPVTTNTADITLRTNWRRAIGTQLINTRLSDAEFVTDGERAKLL